LLPPTHIMEEASFAVLRLIAATGGMTCMKEDQDFGVDALVRSVEADERGSYQPTGGVLDVQLKSTTNVIVDKESLIYDLAAKNHRALTRVKVTIPRVLVLVTLPKDMKTLISINHDHIRLTAEAYFWIPDGVQTTNLESVRIKIPVANRLTPVALRGLLSDRTEV
jgi:hypothetical protein